MRCGQTLQLLDSQACGHYALQYLKAKVSGVDLLNFLSRWSKNNLVLNDARVRWNSPFYKK